MSKQTPELHHRNSIWNLVQLSICTWNVVVVSEGATCPNNQDYQWIVLPPHAAIGFNLDILWSRWNNESSRTKPVQSNGLFFGIHTSWLRCHGPCMCVLKSYVIQWLASPRSEECLVNFLVQACSTAEAWCFRTSSLAILVGQINTPESRCYNKICQTQRKQLCPWWRTLDTPNKCMSSRHRFRGKQKHTSPNQASKDPRGRQNKFIQNENCRSCWSLVGRPRHTCARKLKALYYINVFNKRLWQEK